VERRQLDAVFDPFHHLVIDPGGQFELFAPVDHPVADGMDIRQGRDIVDPGFGGDHPAQDLVHRLPVIPDRLGHLDLRTLVGLESDQALAADPLQHPLGQPPVGLVSNHLQVGLDHLEFHGRGAAVQNQDVHIPLRPPGPAVHGTNYALPVRNSRPSRRNLHRL